MNRINLLITLSLFVFTPPAIAADCVVEERNGKFTESPTNPDSCYFSGKPQGKWKVRLTDGTVIIQNWVNGDLQDNPQNETELVV